MLAHADVAIDGSNSWDIAVHDERLYTRVMRKGTIGLGEAYMDGWWDAPALDEFFYRVTKADLSKKIPISPLLLFWFISQRVLNPQRISRAFTVGEKHYDLGNDLYKAMLDRRMVYTCGYFKNTEDLDEAQEAKLDLSCKKVGLKRGMRILDIGCGWGSFAKFAAEKYGVSVVGITVSKEQAKLAEKECEGLPIEIKVMDYRNIIGSFDAIVSLGMFEHVGFKNYRTYMQAAERVLKDDGLFLLHTIGNQVTRKAGDPWVEKYIFPNSMLPSIAQIGASIEGLFLIEDLHNFGADYDKTLMAWHRNFIAHWPELQSAYDERFFRMWAYFLLSFAGSFRSRKNELWQIVLSKKGVPGGYQSVR